ncbi:MAG: alpha,alpha-phosphotrehalase [Holdemanella sp.]|nr:alpha,alpha-phosphotrehalase [Holdemanella sp.]
MIKRDKVVYQIYPKSFKDSNGDGLGDIRGMIEKLDYLQDLGVDYIWSTPFFVSPQNDNGYDVADYYNIDSRYGTMEDVEELISEAKKRNIGLMFDMVFNHTSTEHEWFKKALAGDEKYQNYYIFKDGTPDKVPTNWASKFGGSAWEYIPHLKKWYLHLFDKTQADLNWDNPEVRDELKKVILFWKEKGVVGYRFDVVNLISKPATFEDDDIGDGRRFYTDGPNVHEYLKELVKDTGMEDMMTVGEMSSTSLENCVRYSNPDEGELAMVFNFHHLKVDYKNGDKWTLQAPDYKQLKNLFKTWQLGIQEGNGLNAMFLCNHDQPRAISRFGNDTKYWKESAEMLATLIHMMQGIPYIYQGEELGMTNHGYTTIEQYRDVESLNYYKILMERGMTSDEALHVLNERSRDNGRTPMQWNSDTYAGFSTVEPWIPLPENYKTINAESEFHDETSIYNYYKKLIQIRKNHRAISYGSISFIDNEDDEVIVYVRECEEERIVVIVNLVEDKKELILHENLDLASKIISNYDSNEVNGNILSLKPYECLVIKTR